MLKTKPARLRRLEERFQNNTLTSEKLIQKMNSPGSIHVTLEYKINKKNEVTFRLIAGKINTKVKRNLKEFLQIEEYLIKYLDNKMPELRSMVPKIEKSKIHSGRDHSFVYEKRLRSIDQFLQTITDMPELWSRDILIFLGIDKGTDQAVFLQKRHE